MTTEACPIEGCPLTGPHGHGVDGAYVGAPELDDGNILYNDEHGYGGGRSYSVDTPGSLDALLLRAYEAGSFDRARLIAEGRPPSDRWVRQRYEEWRRTL